MVNNKSNKSSKKATIATATVVSPGVSAGVSPSGSSAGSSSSPVSTTGSGSITVNAPQLGQVPAPKTKPGSGFRNEITAVVAGISSQLLDDTTLVVNGQTVTQSSLLTSFGNVLSLYGAVAAADQQLKSQRLALEAALPAAHQLYTGLKAALVGVFGKGNPALVAFGFGPKPRALTVEQKVAATTKAKATRKQRGTQGKVQKAQNTFTGTVAVQTSVSGTSAAGGNAPATSGSSAGVSSTPSAGSGTANGSGSTGSSTP
jgi:hypothetical protein